MTNAHAEKFAMFLELIETAKRGDIDVVVVAYPWVLGDTYEELIENLGLLADAKVQLAIGGRR
jgi:hypothetical protein